MDLAWVIEEHESELAAMIGGMVHDVEQEIAQLTGTWVAPDDGKENFSEKTSMKKSLKTLTRYLRRQEETVSDTDDFPEAAKAERERLYPKDETRETTRLARNLFTARIASDQNTTLATAIKKIKVNNLTFSEPWHTLAARSAALNTVDFANHMTSMMDAPAEKRRY